MPNDNDLFPDSLATIRFSSPIASSELHNVYSRTAVRAEEYLNSIQDLILTNKLVGANGFINVESAHQLIYASRSIYGHIDMGAVFSMDNEGRIMGVTADLTWLQVVIAKTLGLQGGSEVIVETDNEGNNLKKIGNLFWREEKQSDTDKLRLKQLDVRYSPCVSIVVVC